MDNFVIYCKSYRNDLERVKVLAQSIERYNIDNIPFYISCPRADRDLFINNLPNFINIINDEDIVDGEINQNWKTQQIIKSQFWKYISNRIV